MRLRRLDALLLAASALASGAPADAQDYGPVIDMHVHAMLRSLNAPVTVCPGNEPLVFPGLDPAKTMSESGSVVCAHPIRSVLNPTELRDRTIAEFRSHNVRRAVVSARLRDLPDWTSRAGDIVIPATSPSNVSRAELNALRRAHASHQITVFAEIGTQYLGKSADAAEFEPFWALAEELDVPVGIHLGEGTVRNTPDPKDLYLASLTSPFQLERVLLRHPRLRLYVMHAASPLTDEMISMLFRYPSLYVDVAANDWNMPRAQFYDQLKRMVDAGFSQRIMFGSDQTIFPQAIGLAIETINEAPFLSSAQKRDILYNNAARFLRLTKEQIAADHRPR